MKCIGYGGEHRQTVHKAECYQEIFDLMVYSGKIVINYYLLD